MRMRFSVTAAVMLLLAALALGACNKSAGNQSGARVPEAQTEAAQPADGVRRVTTQELRAALAKGEAVALDVRGGVEYKLGHIKGAVSMPLGLIKERAGELPKDKLIVAYCA